MASAIIKMHHGAPAIYIDGKLVPPMLMTVNTKNKQYLKDIGAAGIRLFILCCDTNWLKPGGEIQRVHNGGFVPAEDATLNGMKQLRSFASALFEAVPDAYVMLRIGLHPSTD